MKFDRQLQLRLPATLDDALRVVSSRTGLSRSEYVRVLIALALDPKMAKILARFARRVQEELPAT